MALKQVQTTCAYCGAGCQIMFTVDTDANKIVEAVPADGRTNAGTLCLKGHYGWDYLNDPQILTKRLRKPMIRKGGKKSPLVEVSWEEAISYVAKRLGEDVYKRQGLRLLHLQQAREAQARPMKRL